MRPSQDFYCFDSKYIESGRKQETDIIHPSICTCKQSQILDILGNIEILARMHSRKISRMVTLY